MQIKFKNLIIGVAFGVISTLVLMVVFSFSLYLFGIDKCYSSLFATLSVSGGSFVSSFFLARKTGKKGYLSGLIMGGLYFVSITAVSLIITKSHISANTAFHFIIIMLSSLVGGIMGVNKKKTKLI